MTAAPPRLESLLGLPPARAWWRRPVVWLALAGVAAALGAGLAWQARRAAQQAPHYATEPITRGRLVVSVTANGTLAPTHEVAVGSELSGTVAQVLADVNDRVRRGQVLVQLDATKLRDQARRSGAAVAVAQARVRQAEATVREAEGQLARLREVARLSGGQVPSRAELAAGEAALARAEADAASARAGVVDAQAAARVDATNLAKSSIRAPIDGVVLARTVEPGNAVAASLQAVTLMRLAEDLRRMTLALNVDEADVGQVHAGQRATFGVSTWPQRRFAATVRRVGYGATTKDNVVTYLAELEVDNDDLALRPGMTATAVIAAVEREDVLRVPNAALRFDPAARGGAAASAPPGIVARLLPRLPAPARRSAGVRGAAAGQVWVLRDGQPVALPVVPGLSDGRHTEVTGDGVREGLAVITAQSAAPAR